jgi:hypothetical protein
MERTSGRAVIAMGLTLAGFLLTASNAAGSSRGRSGRSAQRVVARDESGRLLTTGRYLWLAHGQAGVPASLYEQLGLWVRRDRRGRWVRLAVPQSDVTVTFRPGRHRVTGQSANLRILRPRVPYPVARVRRGEFYVAASAVQREFQDVIQTRWRPRTRTLTIQRVAKPIPNTRISHPAGSPAVNVWPVQGKGS